jgi:hypothetical protein
MTIWWNVKLLKWKVDEMVSCWNGKLMKWQADEMARWWNEKLMRLQVDETASWWDCKLMKPQMMILQVDKMASWWNGKLTKWFSAIFFYKKGDRGARKVKSFQSILFHLPHLRFRICLHIKGSFTRTILNCDFELRFCIAFLHCICWPRFWKRIDWFKRNL